ncbi:metal dependent phosphohydrolase [Desulfitobacterium hafniense DCB-2]|uniref:Metal dependent phosphohydrolase n=1 Tax=Desulfitobacterium hafniense (strain DSM 10664 / DCB-2) TaxID=272564 RepID=B8FWT3_DESHD|nr:HDIG domain-containing metalloprotein [Desulfitobacterium hafniense]ACL22581.1 metal dependent phosphohydrolase [Desulfitobacterium hafniense DCB-2]
MPDYTRDREAAWQLLNEYVKSETLLRHSLTVEAVMRHFASLYQEDPDLWGNIGLLHDIDFEMYPDQHCRKTREILTPQGLPEEFIRAIESHGYGLVHDVEPRENVEKVLFTIDELTGLVSATALLRPSKSLHDLTAKSVKKKWKQKSFAENVNREVIEAGANRLGKDLNEIIEETIKGMRTVAVAIGLEGNIEAGAEAGK